MEEPTLAAKIKSKAGYINYLKNRLDDPVPVEKEIHRLEQHAFKLLAQAREKRDMLNDLPGALDKANEEMLELRKLQGGRAEAEAMDKQLADQAREIEKLRKQLEALTAALA